MPRAPPRCTVSPGDSVPAMSPRRGATSRWVLSRCEGSEKAGEKWGERGLFTLVEACTRAHTHAHTCAHANTHTCTHTHSPNLRASLRPGWTSVVLVSHPPHPQTPSRGRLISVSWLGHARAKSEPHTVASALGGCFFCLIIKAVARAITKRSNQLLRGYALYS